MRRDAPNRRRPPRSAATTILVYCGGLRTEPDYFDGLRLHLRTSAVTIKVKGDKAAPTRLVQLAAGYRDQRPGVFDAVWCVVDVDQFDLAAAVALARQRNVNLAISNPCFELWLLLHHADCTAHCGGYEDVVARLVKHVPTYDKTRLDFGDYVTGMADAVRRAKELEPDGTNHGVNPSTSVWRLVERITEQ